MKVETMIWAVLVVFVIGFILSFMGCTNFSFTLNQDNQEQQEVKKEPVIITENNHEYNNILLTEEGNIISKFENDNKIGNSIQYIDKPIYIDKEIIKEVSKETIKEIEKIVYQDKIIEVPKEVIKEIIKEVPKETIKEIEKIVYQDKIIEVPKEIIKEIIKEVPINKPIDKTALLNAFDAADIKIRYYSYRSLLANIKQEIDKL